MNISPVLICLVLICSACSKKSDKVDHAAEIQKDPLFINYMKSTRENNFSSEYDFPVDPKHKEKKKEAKAKGKLIEYYKSIKDVNGVSYYEFVYKNGHYKSLQNYIPLHRKYIVEYKLPKEFIKHAIREYYQANVFTKR